MLEIEKIADCVSEIEYDYQLSPGLILSEDDAKCLLFGKIHAHLAGRGESRGQTAQKSILASPLHTEIKFLDRNGALSIRPDITVMETRNLSLVHSRDGLNVNRKGFVFYGTATAIEIKFCKAIRGINSRFTSSIQSDCEKLIEIRRRLYPPAAPAIFRAVVVVFNRSDLVCHHFNDLRARYSENSPVRIMYASANFNAVAAAKVDPEDDYLGR